MRCIGILEMSSTFLVSDESELIFIERVKLAYLECEHIPVKHLHPSSVHSE